MSQIQTSPAPAAEWCAQMQAKLMAAIDAAWAMAERSDDPAVIARARDKARLCGQMAAEARKIAALVPAPKAKAEALEPVSDAQLEAAARAAFDEAMAERLREAAPDKPPAAQAVAMRAALRKMGRDTKTAPASPPRP